MSICLKMLKIEGGRGGGGTQPNIYDQRATDLQVIAIQVSLTPTEV